MVFLRRKKRTAVVAEGVVFPVGLLPLYATTPLFIAGVDVDDIMPVPLGQGKDRGVQ